LRNFIRRSFVARSAGPCQAANDDIDSCREKLGGASDRIPAEQIATIGDMPNDTAVFARSGSSIAMGESSDEVKKAATYVTTSSEAKGFANAIDRYVLGPEMGR
jgi:3-deoxy-D-manno-octulosonate 8-phosphate phosphatase KdsC-like HAD superfamily phosphatase